MKKINFILVLMLVNLSTLEATTTIVKPKYGKAIKSKKENFQQRKDYDAYCFWQDRLYRGTITLIDGKLYDYNFRDLENDGVHTQKYIPSNAKFYALNENNKLAIQYNFTHYVEIPSLGGRVYIIAN
jgi:hypothetical protein